MCDTRSSGEREYGVEEEDSFDCFAGGSSSGVDEFSIVRDGGRERERRTLVGGFVVNGSGTDNLRSELKFIGGIIAREEDSNLSSWLLCMSECVFEGQAKVAMPDGRPACGDSVPDKAEGCHQLEDLESTECRRSFKLSCAIRCVSNADPRRFGEGPSESSMLGTPGPTNGLSTSSEDIFRLVPAIECLVANSPSLSTFIASLTFEATKTR